MIIRSRCSQTTLRWAQFARAVLIFDDGNCDCKTEYDICGGGPSPDCCKPEQKRRPRMKTSKRTTITAIAGVSLAALLTCANAAQSLKIDFSDETVGAEPKSFVSVVG